MTDKILNLPPPGGRRPDGPSDVFGPPDAWESEPVPPTLLSRSRRGPQDETYPAPNLLLTAGPVRRRALTIIAVPLVVIVLFMQPWKAFASNPSAPDYGTGGFPSSSYPQPEDSSTDGGSAFGGATSSSDATDNAYGQTSDSPSPDPSPSPTSTGPDGVVIAYFDAINRSDFETAWSLGGDNLDSTYQDFVNGFTGTARDEVTVVSVSGDQIQVDLNAQQTDGTEKSFTGTYTVDNGVITAAHLQQTN